jgi:uncharacterized membrane protein
VIGVVGGALFDVVVDPSEWVAWPLVGSLGLVAGAGFGLGSYRRTVAVTEAALDAFLENLAISVAAMTGAAPPP